MTTKIAQALSIILHPLLMSTYLFGIIFFASPEAIINLEAYNNSFSSNLLHIGFKENLLIFIFLGTFASPACLIYYLFKLKLISSLQMEDLKSRRLPYFITFIFYMLLSLFLFKRFPDLREVPISLFTISLCIFIVFVISLFWQISAHAVGISGVLGVVAAFIFIKEIESLFIPLLILLILTGLVCAARLKLNAHTPMQIIMGLILGLSISISSTIFFI